MNHRMQVIVRSIVRITSPYFVRILLFGATSVLFSLQLAAQGGAERLFDEGNLLYQQEDFQGARDKYLQIESQGEVSSALYYNLGNSYYRLGSFGKAILYYERALRLDPGDDDIQANLQAANQATVDRITPPQQFQLARWLIWLLYVISTSSLIKLATGLYLSACVLLILGILSRNSRTSSAMKRGALALGTVLLLTLSMVGAQWVDSRKRVEAVVMASEVKAMGAPDDDSVELFQIHEGTKVRIDDSTDDWIEIVLVDGKVGWVHRESVEII